METSVDESGKEGGFKGACSAVSSGFIYVEEAVTDSFIITALVSKDTEVVRPA